MVTVELQIKVDHERYMPQRAHEGDAGFDLCARGGVELMPGQRKLVPTGVRIALPPGFEAQVRPRSGLALKHGITIVNSPGTVDAGYRGELGIILLNTGDQPFSIKDGERIAQMVIQELPEVDVNVVDELPPSARGTGGYGSTGNERRFFGSANLKPQQGGT